MKNIYKSVLVTFVTCLTACSGGETHTQQSTTPPYRHLPMVGMTKADALKVILKRGEVYEGANWKYVVDLDGTKVLVEMLYSRDSHGIPRVMHVNVNAVTFGGGLGLTAEMVRESKREILPGDFRVMKESEVGPDVAADGKGNQPNEDFAYLHSNSLSKTLTENAYYDRGKHTGKCPYSDPGIIEEYRQTEKEGLTRLGFFSPYLDKCAYKILE